MPKHVAVYSMCSKKVVLTVIVFLWKCAECPERDDGRNRAREPCIKRSQNPGVSSETQMARTRSSYNSHDV